MDEKETKQFNKLIEYVKQLAEQHNALERRVAELEDKAYTTKCLSVNLEKVKQ